ncbi:hypothetical protein COCC4DRAFT_144674 [Bipolaris maydis ATCC 48331]|uniref:Uncharacterized protein n=2 Tax=Cochliobolus heterostrophus TaxID=5016 RepID=M2VCG7_COCH5|nr:uncharacterized protein COCC4DRAFT_144674 [Bipolaris maydis ATCC 48331]EMD97712.1 hypothetical protein COCHEDRAFT_1200316 [Bipolaris maydis C5]KAH7564580.1 hypothetical protein BM1_01627 [Bipolaris maydis]ENI02891.1 hypothetical protein COCC4DRAFT_144674 [Bipolaris maydis ATCC 48331]KAJ5031800.1 hypothetical protein J3E73DRAFT_428830 [Bipolaris maydis]KAJ5060147.1 integral membrane protein-like protein [Bipolaris maydis]
MPSFYPVTATAIALAFILVYTICSLSTHDPTSIFFDASNAYTPRYSALRYQQATAYISIFNSTSSVGLLGSKDSNKKLCIGIPSVARHGPQYLPGAIGSLLDGLTVDERNEFYLVVFIPHSDPKAHPAYRETWLSRLADRVLAYEGLDAKEMAHVRRMEAQGGAFKEKGLYDYSYLVSKCAELNTPYIAILEDDVLAMDGWYHRTINALLAAEDQSIQRHGNKFLYLRLFYTEAFLGWNSEEWKTYLFYSLCFAAMPAAVVSFLRTTKLSPKLLLPLNTHLRSSEVRSGYSFRRLVATFYALMAVFILLFFALGRMTVLPLPAGVHEMPQFGCCSQAFVFPRQKALELVSYFAQVKTGYVDVLTERYADARGELRYAITPSLFQHVGKTSSKMDSHGPIIKGKTWSFAFEEYDPGKLRQEHETVGMSKDGLDEVR